MRKLGILAVILGLSACQNDLVRSDFIDASAGDALARNTVNQMVDPWNSNVYNTDIETSGERQAAVRKKYLLGTEEKEVESPETTK